MIFHKTSMYLVQVYNWTVSVHSKHALATQTFREGRESGIGCAKVPYLNSLIY